MNSWAWWRNRARRESELEEEIQTHLRLAERDRMERGETAARARANVRREFGNLLLLARIQALPGIVSASRSAVTPISGLSWQWDVRVESPIGRVYRDDAPPGAPAKEFVTEIVGFARDAKYRRLRDAAPPTIYLPILQNPAPFPIVGTYALRFKGPLNDLKIRVQQAVLAMNPRVSLEFRLLSEQVEDSLLQERLVALLSALFGVLALLLAVIGLYGVIAYSVTRRFHEIDIRMALGAGRGAVEWLVLREVGALLFGGLTLGVAVTLTAAHLVQSLLYGLAPNDPGTLTGACVLLLAVGVTAGWIPARRAARVDPMASLRHE